MNSTDRGVAGIGLTRGDLAQNTAQALLKGIPFVGEPLSQFIFGPLQDIRWHRLEQTLRELGEALKGPAHIETEEFVNLLEKVGPRVARETSEQRRRCFRDLLVNAASIESGSAAWADANLAADMIAGIEPPGLAIIAALNRCSAQQNYLSSEPSPRVFDGGQEFTKPTDTFFVIDYGWPVVEEWVYRIKEQRLIWLTSGDARGGFGGITLTPLGRFLVEWGMRATDR